MDLRVHTWKQTAVERMVAERFSATEEIQTGLVDRQGVCDNLLGHWRGPSHWLPALQSFAEFWTHVRHPLEVTQDHSE